MIRTVLVYSINCLFFFFFSLTHTPSHFYPASYIQMQMQNPPGHIFVYTYVRAPSATAARRSNVFLHHQEGFCVINTRFQVKLPIGIRAWKNNKNKAAAESVFKQKKITFRRNDRLRTDSRLREQRIMRQCDRCTFSAIAGLSSFFALDHSSTGAFAPRC